MLCCVFLVFFWGEGKRGGDWHEFRSFHSFQRKRTCNCWEWPSTAFCNEIIVSIVAFPQLSAGSSEEQLQIMCHHSHPPGLQCRPGWNSLNLTTWKLSCKSVSASIGFHQDGNLYDLFPPLVPVALLSTCHQKKADDTPRASPAMKLQPATL